jgi:hypothetical protein
MLLFVFALLIIERVLRRQAPLPSHDREYRDLRGMACRAGAGCWRAALAPPALFGFMLPAAVLLHDALVHGGRFGAGVLGGRGGQPYARRGGGASRSALPWCSLTRGGRRASADPGGEHAARHQLCDPRHLLRHRPAHSLLAGFDNFSTG